MKTCAFGLRVRILDVICCSKFLAPMTKSKSSSRLLTLSSPITFTEVPGAYNPSFSGVESITYDSFFMLLRLRAEYVKRNFAEHPKQQFFYL